MIEIITDTVAMPSLEKRRFQKHSPDNYCKKWVVIDTEDNSVRYRGKFEDVSLACYNLNKKHYRAQAQSKLYAAQLNQIFNFYSIEKNG
jgi:hypothetical protein